LCNLAKHPVASHRQRPQGNHPQPHWLGKLMGMRKGSHEHGWQHTLLCKDTAPTMPALHVHMASAAVCGCSRTSGWSVDLLPWPTVDFEDRRASAHTLSTHPAAPYTRKSKGLACPDMHTQHT
jgi:hypothetical protein